MKTSVLDTSFLFFLFQYILPRILTDAYSVQATFFAMMVAGCRLSQCAEVSMNRKEKEEKKKKGSMGNKNEIRRGKWELRK